MRQGLTLVHFSAQPEPFPSLKVTNNPAYPNKSAYIQLRSGSPYHAGIARHTLGGGGGEALVGAAVTLRLPPGPHCFLIVSQCTRTHSLFSGHLTGLQCMTEPMRGLDNGD